MAAKYLIKEKQTGKFFCSIWKNNWMLVGKKPVQQSEFDCIGKTLSYNDAMEAIKQLTTVSKASSVDIYPKYREEDLELVECGEDSSDIASRLEDWFNRYICLYAGYGNNKMNDAYFTGKPIINEVMMLLAGRKLR